MPPPTGGAATTGINLQPAHALWALAGLSVIAVFLFGVGWLLVAAGLAFAGWQAQNRGITWPADLEEVLIRAKLTQPGVHTVPPAHTPTAVIPFRPLSFPEIFTGAFKVVTRAWPTLIGIPVVIFVGAIAIAAVVMFVMMQMAMSAMDGTDLSSSAQVDGMFTALVTMWLVGLLVFYAVALPIDALLLTLSYTATYQAVRGVPVQMVEVFAVARRRMWPALRLMMVYYGIFLVPELLLLPLVYLAVMVPLALPLLPLLFVASFGIGILFSLAPVVLLVENRGAIDSLKRSMQLTRVAWPRLLGIHILWAICAVPLIFVPALVTGLVLGMAGMLIFVVVAFGALIALTRTLQTLVYTDLRIRQENYERELIAEGARNTGSQPI